RPKLRWNLSKVFDRAVAASGSFNVEVCWNVLREQEHTFRERALATFQLTLDDYVKRMRQKAELQAPKKPFSADYAALVEGLSERARTFLEATTHPLPRLMKLPYRFSPRHYDWLVQYQILGTSRNRIAEEHGQDRSVVGDGVNRAA